MTLIASLFMITAAAAGVAGWLLPRPDGERRFTWRYLACGAGFVVFAIATVEDSSSGDWLWAAGDLVLTWYLLGRFTHWWRAAERERQLARLLARRHD